MLVAYVILLLFANYLAFGQFLPPTTEKGLWFYTGLASVLLGNLLVTPFFTKPADAISYSVVGLIALYSANHWYMWNKIEKILFLFSLLFCLLVLVTSFASILTKDSTSKKGQQWSNTFRVLAEMLGDQRVIFTVIIVFALIAFHRTSAREMTVITGVLLSSVFLTSDHFNKFRRFTRIWKVDLVTDVVGEIVAHKTPGIVILRQKVRGVVPFGTILYLRDEHFSPHLGLSIGYFGRDSSLLLRVITMPICKDIEKKLEEVRRITPIGCASDCNYIIGDKSINKKVPLLEQSDHIVGIVAQDTSLEHLYIEVIQTLDIEEGRLVQVSIKEKPVIYQVIEGITKEEVIYQKNTYGYAQAKARKIGIWDDDKQKFTPAKWIPELNAPVIIKRRVKSTPDVGAIGHFPDSSYNVKLESVHDLVTHNTAILGILGVGKSMLAIELVERMIKENIKVICLDLTNQYMDLLKKFVDVEEEQNKIQELNDIGVSGKDKASRNVEEGGSIREFTQAVEADLREFMQDSCDFLKIYNPSSFEVWKQAGGMYKQSAAMATLTPTEITKIISEVALKIAQDRGMTEEARICLVYEEAHSLVPEWTSVVSDGDKAATNGTARAILQGRKYGLGCLLITQRTANVTKTILNQCNTIFAMRTFDDTGKEFLSNYIGSDYALMLPSLQARQAVFFGKASNCENPVLIRLNDRENFLSVFRDE